jgi:hypothetical protein
MESSNQITKHPPAPEWREMGRGSVLSMPNECDECGSDRAIVLTVSADERLYDGDLIECHDCGLRGSISVVDGQAFCAWDEIEAP